MHSALYEGWVDHRRNDPLEHGFRYRISLVYLDLDELDEAFRGRWLWSCRKPSLAWFRRRDHFGDPAMSLAHSVRQLLVEKEIDTGGGSIRLLTQLRYWGFVMNPVSFYYCYDPAEQLQAVVAEVHNTPWGERHCYVLRVGEAEQPECWLNKEFHVSPFMPMQVRYRWQLTPPGEQLNLQIENFAADARFFTATMQLQRRAWTTLNLHRAFWLYPFMTQRIFVGIYWQALRLWWKGARYYPHPGPAAPAVVKGETPCSDLG